MWRALSVLLLLLARRADAQELEQALPGARAHPQSRPRIGLVLSGGGARGCAHVGVLEVLDELHVPVDVVSGTSMGSIVGGLFALGYSPAELRGILADIDWADAFEDRPPRPQRSFRRKQDDIGFLSEFRLGLHEGALRFPRGLIEGQRLGLLLRSLSAPAERFESFDDFPRPFRALATDLESGAAVVMDRGDLPTALRASMSIPGVFSPVEREGAILMDGGFADNVPVDAARQMGADVLIVVDLSEDLPGRAQIQSPLGMINQVLGYAVTGNSRASLATLGPRDVVIQPSLEGMSSTEFARAADSSTSVVRRSAP